METAILGRTGLKVSRLGAGLAEIGSLADSATAGRLFNIAFDGGINFLDTAACYGNSEEWIGRTISHRRQEYILATNAGASLEPEADVLEVPIESIGKTLAVNFYGPLHMTRAFIPVMKMNNYGRVVNVSSTGGSLSLMSTLQGTMAAYRVSKAALNALTRLTAGAVKDYNIKVNSMCPGRIRTDMGGPDAPRSSAKGAGTIIWLATLPAAVQVANPSRIGNGSPGSY